MHHHDNKGYAQKYNIINFAAAQIAHTQLVDLFAPVADRTDSEAVEVFLADGKIREDFYKLLCAFGRALNLVLNAEQAYRALSKDERKNIKITSTAILPCASVLRIDVTVIQFFYNIPIAFTSFVYLSPLYTKVGQ